jgi:hypothetical protein
MARVGVGGCFFLLSWLRCWAATSQTTHIWQGFHHEWQRKVVDFETPHRFGSFRNWLVGDAFSVEFTTGVNGDFAFPETHFASAQVDAGYQAETGQISFTLEDELVKANNTALVQHAQVAPAGDLLLQGVAIEMKCIQPGVCNSNAVWPTKLMISLCGNGQAPCEVRFELGRGYTPAHGGGKPLNTRMQYNVTLQWLRVSDTKGKAVVSQFSRNSSIHDKNVASKASIKAGPGILGLRGFGFDMVESRKHNDLGRYLEGLDFSVFEWSYQEHEHQFQWSAGLWAPKASTYDSNLHSWLDVMVLPVPAQIEYNRVLNGTVCVDDKAFPQTFKCKKHGLPQQLSAEVPVPALTLPSIVI